MDRLVCRISGYICYDTNGVTAYMATLRKLKHRPLPPVHRCPNAVLHPERPYHVGHRRNLHRAA